MDLNTKGRYAVMALADLAKYGAGGSLPLSTIAERQRISLAYLEQLFQPLRRAGLVESVRGRAGGYALARTPALVRISDIMLAVEEPVKMTRCAGGEVGCVGDERCLTHDLWSALGDQIMSFLSDVTLQDVLDGLPGKAPARSADEWARKFGLAAE